MSVVFSSPNVDSVLQICCACCCRHLVRKQSVICRLLNKLLMFHWLSEQLVNTIVISSWVNLIKCMSDYGLKQWQKCDGSAITIIAITLRRIMLQTYMYNDLFLYNCKTSEWTLLKAPNAPAPRCAHQVIHCTHHCSLTVIELGCKAEHLYIAPCMVYKPL